MSLFKRGNVWWYEFWFANRRVCSDQFLKSDIAVGQSKTEAGEGRTIPLSSLLLNALFCVVACFAASRPQVRIDLARNTPREAQAKATLEQVLGRYDLSKYIFTDHVFIEQGAMNHAFPVLTLNPRFANSPDELLSSFVHEQLHWYLREHNSQQRAAVAELRRMYPNVPVGLPEGADTLYSTYAHLIDCYLEIQADRQTIGAERTKAVIEAKPHYTWVYGTILRDEPRIAQVANEHNLRVE